MSTSIDVTLELDAELLMNRSCARCGSVHFRAIKHTPTVGEHNDVTDMKWWRDCPTSIPLAICINCKRIVSLF